MDKFNYFRKIEEHQLANKGEIADPWLKEAKQVEYPINGNSVVKDGNKFMRLAVCNRKVVEENGRPVYHIDKPKTNEMVLNPVAMKQDTLQKKVVPTKTYKSNPNNLYLLTSVIGLGHFQTGFAIMASNTIAAALKAKFEWTP